MSVETPAQTPAPEGQIGEIQIGEIKVERGIRLEVNKDRALVGIEINVCVSREIRYIEREIVVEYCDRDYLRPYAMPSDVEGRIDEYILDLLKSMESDLYKRVQERTNLILRILSLRSIIPIEVVEG